ncbi:hypothetical protein FF011L_09250 [Roseimaritima multifibrata]|uniref:Uncharacterized protein n=1 Tax=Roseimaritima multifibrata TaxID=1930274 RepID=A0A517MBB5_9BACT|nr:hypothetical protein FF011L_09250 [Roseimaritima multifibrata]
MRQRRSGLGTNATHTSRHSIRFRHQRIIVTRRWLRQGSSKFSAGVTHRPSSFQRRATTIGSRFTIPAAPTKRAFAPHVAALAASASSIRRTANSSSPPITHPLRSQHRHRLNHQSSDQTNANSSTNRRENTHNNLSKRNTRDFSIVTTSLSNAMELARQGDKETRRQGDKETRRQGDKETRSWELGVGSLEQKQPHRATTLNLKPSSAHPLLLSFSPSLLHSLHSLSPCLPVSLSPCLPVSLSPCLPVSLSPCLRVSQQPLQLPSCSIQS